MFEQYLNQIKTLRADGTYIHYKRVLANFEGQDINAETVLKFMEREDLSVNSKKSYLGILVTALKNIGKLSTDIKLLVKSIRGEEIIQPTPTSRDVERIINSTDNPMFKCLIALMAYSGLRISECTKIKVSDIRDNKILIRETKTHNQRFVPISPKLKPYLVRWLKSIYRQQGIYLFQSKRTGQMYSISYFKSAVKGICLDAGYSQYHCHSFRHFFATTIYKVSNNNIALTAKACGHKSIKTTMRYIGTQIEDIAKYANLF